MTFQLTAVASCTHSEGVSCCYTTVEIPFTVFLSVSPSLFSLPPQSCLKCVV